MSNKKEFVKDITNIDEDFAQWYTDIVTKANYVQKKIYMSLFILC